MIKDKPQRKPKVKYSKECADFVATQLENGTTVSEICKKYPDTVPNRQTIIRWQDDNPEFKERMDFAYQCWIQGKLDELEHMSTVSIHELYPALEARDAYEQRRTRMDALKFLLGKMAPMLSKRWSKVDVVEHKGLENIGPSVLIMNYSTPKPIDITPSTLVIDSK